MRNDRARAGYNAVWRFGIVLQSEATADYTTVFCGEILDFASTKNFADLLDLFKGPNYEFIRQQVSKDVKVNYQKKFRRSMASLVEFLRQR
jgi:hypothetical protein